MSRDKRGEAYEASILQVITDAKKRGEFYTPYELSLLISKIVGKVESVHDPACGSGSLLLTVDAKEKHGIELNGLTANMARENLPNAEIIEGNTLEIDAPGMFEAVVSNPPYSTEWAEYDPFDPRWIQKPLPPKSKSDLAFVLHGVHCMKRIGVFVVFPGVLYRSGAEAKIRTWLIDHNLVDTVIQLPEKMFLRTSIGVCLLILKKDREPDAPILWVDASDEFKAQGKLNVLKTDKILDAVLERKEVERFSVLAKPIDDTLTVTSFVDIIPPKEKIDIHKLNISTKLLHESTKKGLDLWDDLIYALESGNKKTVKDLQESVTAWKEERDQIKSLYKHPDDSKKKLHE